MLSCHLCRSQDMVSLIDFGRHPIAHRLLTHPAEGEYTHPVDLYLCNECGLIQLGNPALPEMFYTTYNWLSAWKPQPHVSHVVELIRQLPRLRRDSAIVEVGSNDGSFLVTLREWGYGRLTGIEPSRDALEAARSNGIETVGAYFTPDVARDLVSTRGPCDLLIARQVLEHIADLPSVAEAIRLLISPDGYVLIEVPNFAFSLAAFDYSAVWEEHVNHFTLATLRKFLIQLGLRIAHVERANFCGEALIVLAERDGQLPAVPDLDELADLRANAFAYRDEWRPFRTRLVQYLDSQKRAGRKVAVYGGGNRACCLINFAGLAPYLEFVVDDQPEKQGKYLPGSRLRILPGGAIEAHGIQVCLLAVNAENEIAVISRHRPFVARGGEFASLLPPSDRLLPVWGQGRSARR